MKTQFQLSSVLGISLLLLNASLSVSAPKTVSRLGEFDVNFLKAVDQSNNSECAYVPTVMKRASSAQVKQFAQQMLRDHTQANKELAKLAASKRVKLSHDVPDEEQAVIDRLGQERGSKFDAAYQNEMVRDHTEDINDMEREISLGTDPQVKAYATKYLPILKHHLQMAQELKVAGGKVGTSGSKMTMPKDMPMAH